MNNEFAILDEDEIAAAVIINEHEEEAVERRVRRAENAFMLPERQFIKYFRVSKDLARYIIELITPLVNQPTRASALNTERKLLIALKFFGFGSYQEITGSNIFTAVSQSSVSKALDEICNALNNPIIFDEWIKFPSNMQELEAMRSRFHQKYNFPGIVGCVDCTHVAITKATLNDPARPEHIYVNRKGYHSINVQLICDPDLRIINVNARFPGSAHDAHIWRESAVSRTMEQIFRNNNNNVFFLLGDSGYPLRPWLLTPLRDVQPNTPEQRFNDSLTSVRSIIERCNGVLKNRFRCLLKDRVLHYAPTKAGKIINACVVLHNMCISFNVPVPEVNEDLGDLGIYENLARLEGGEGNEAHARVNADLAFARQLQRRIIHNHFR